MGTQRLQCVWAFRLGCVHDVVILLLVREDEIVGLRLKQFEDAICHLLVIRFGEVVQVPTTEYSLNAGIDDGYDGHPLSGGEHGVEDGVAGEDRRSLPVTLRG